MQRLYTGGVHVLHVVVVSWFFFFHVDLRYFFLVYRLRERLYTGGVTGLHVGCGGFWFFFLHVVDVGRDCRFLESR